VYTKEITNLIERALGGELKGIEPRGTLLLDLGMPSGALLANSLCEGGGVPGLGGEKLGIVLILGFDGTIILFPGVGIGELRIGDSESENDSFPNGEGRMDVNSSILVEKLIELGGEVANDQELSDRDDSPFETAIGDRLVAQLHFAIECDCEGRTTNTGSVNSSTKRFTRAR
jgi:hypothetical protein